MIEQITYICEHCDAEFLEPDACRKHEETCEHDNSPEALWQEIIEKIKSEDPEDRMEGKLLLSGVKHILESTGPYFTKLKSNRTVLPEEIQERLKEWEDMKKTLEIATGSFEIPWENDPKEQEEVDREHPMAQTE